VKHKKIGFDLQISLEKQNSINGQSDEAKCWEKVAARFYSEEQPQNHFFYYSLPWAESRMMEH
jgi:hypothetical protein